MQALKLLCRATGIILYLLGAARTATVATLPHTLPGSMLIGALMQIAERGQRSLGARVVGRLVRPAVVGGFVPREEAQADRCQPPLADCHRPCYGTHRLQGALLLGVAVCA